MLDIIEHDDGFINGDETTVEPEFVISIVTGSVDKLMEHESEVRICTRDAEKEAFIANTLIRTANSH